MNINNFREHFSSTIYNRGLSYYRRGKVLSVSKNDSVYTAKVEGSSTYTVKVDIDELGNVRTISCNCPYGSNCKHDAAVLYYIKHDILGGRFTETKRAPSAPFAAKAQKAADVQSSPAVRSLIESYSERAQKASIAENSGTVKLFPQFGYDRHRLSFSLRIGITRTYSVQNIEKLCGDFKLGIFKKYGKELEFTHDRSRLDEDSRKLLDVLSENIPRIYNWHLLSYTNDDIWIRKVLEIYDGKTVAFNGEPTPVLCADPPIWLRVKAEDGGYKVSVIAPPDCWSDKEGIYYLKKENAVYVSSEEYRDNAVPLLNALKRYGNAVFVHNNDIRAFYSAVLMPVSDMLPIAGEELLEDFAPPALEAKLWVDYSDGMGVCARLDFVYDDKTYTAFGNKADNPFCNFSEEAAAEALVLKYFRQGCEDIRYTLSVSGDEQIYRLMSEGISELRSKMDVYATDSFDRIKLRPPVSVSVGIRPKSALLELDINADDYSLSELAELLGAYRKGRKFHRLRDGSFASVSEESIGELSAMLSALNVSDRTLAKGKPTVPQYRLLYLNILQSDSGDLRIKRSAEFRKMAEKYSSVGERVFEEDPPEELAEIMRGYQKFGYFWLKTIKEYGFGGILADDMGLGKTLQSLALVLNEKQTNKNFKTALVVCPSSLTLNWADEVRKFTPSLKAAAVIGTAAERTAVIEKISEYDIIITSYASLMRDIEQYKKVQFGLHFIDEAQYIKNHTTQSAKAVKAVKSETRFALTGTPVENSLAELWSIFDFIMPDYLFTYTAFKTRFETPIVKEKSESAAALLGKMTAPFILRRLKKDVLKELPDKTETVLAAEMTDEQKKLYTANLLALKSELTEEDGFGGDNTKRFQVLAMLTRLRQLCCDPSLVYEDYGGGSAKLEQCMELMESCIAGGHKVLLFSQFTSMLDIIAARLDEGDISYFMLTGKTKPRERLSMVNRFNADDTKVFLISLKAGGTGLNLTGADIVIHYDPWWNVSAENQASDRAYRIGQKNNVQIYKLIAGGTVEEKIQDLQKAKAELAEMVLNPDADITKMTAGEILELLK